MAFVSCHPSLYPDDAPLITRSGLLATAMTLILGAAVVYNVTVTQAGRGRSVSQRGDANVVEIDARAAAAARTQVHVAPAPVPAVAAAQTPTQPARKSDPLLASAERELAALGLYDGPADGLPSAALKDAVAAFQHKAGLPVTGKVDQDFMDRLLLTRQIAQAAGTEEPAPAPAAAPAPQSQAPAQAVNQISLVQTRLAELGYRPGAITGRMTPETIAAIRQFEADRKLPGAGQITALLISELKQMSGLSALGTQ